MRNGLRIAFLHFDKPDPYNTGLTWKLSTHVSQSASYERTVERHETVFQRPSIGFAAFNSPDMACN
jgi:hypothetical protein